MRFAVLTVCSIIAVHTLPAQWSNDTLVNTPVFVGPGNQFAPIGVSDGSGGAFVVWFDQKTNGAEIRAQRLDATGTRQFPSSGAPPTGSALIFQSPTGTVAGMYKDAIPDGLGGAIVTWSATITGSATGSDVFAQRVGPGVTTSWTPDPRFGGVVVCETTNVQSMPHLVSDGAGGAIIVWQDHRAGGVGNVYAQRLNSLGEAQWPRNGVVLCTAPGGRLKPMVTSDGRGGAIAVWEDVRESSSRLYAQRIDGLGRLQWPDLGAIVLYRPVANSLRGIVSDDAEGAIVCGQNRDEHGDRVLAQRISGQGNTMWEITNGVIVNGPGKVVNPLIVPDGSGGAVFAWEDSTEGSRQVNIYAQRVSPSGTLLWPAPNSASAIPVSEAPFEQYYFSMIGNANGGAIIAWTDARNWPAPTGLDVYVQSLDGSGVPQWRPDGAPVSRHPPLPPPPGALPSAQTFPNLIGSDGGTGIVIWNDDRNSGTPNDIYAQGLSEIGLGSSQTKPVIAANTNVSFIGGGTGLVTANFSTLGSVNQMTVRAFLNATPPGLTNALPRYLDLSANGSGFNATLTFNYTDQEVQTAGLVNGDAYLTMYKDEGSGWTLQGGTVDTAANTVTITNVTSFSLWAIRDTLDTLATTIDSDIGVPSSFALLQNYPNPFNPATTIQFSIANPQFTILRVYDVLGHEVATLVNEEMQPGSYEVTWDARGMSSGVYFYRLQTSNSADTKKLLLLR